MALAETALARPVGTTLAGVALALTALATRGVITTRLAMGFGPMLPALLLGSRTVTLAARALGRTIRAGRARAWTIVIATAIAGLGAPIVAMPGGVLGTTGAIAVATAITGRRTGRAAIATRIRRGARRLRTVRAMFFAMFAFASAVAEGRSGRAAITPSVG